jgi:predicted O-methyltransferase YrrM
MYSPPQLALKYLGYLLKASNGKGHGIHSPFVYEFIRNVLLDKHSYPAYAQAEQYRNRLLNDERVIEVDDLGAGSGRISSRTRRVSEIARTSGKPKRLARLIYRIASHYGHRQILELGTSLGITSSYLARVPALENLTTIEGAGNVAEIAREEFERSGLKNVSLVVGSFDDCLERELDAMQKVDLAFIDGNHRREPTLQYFEKMIPYLHESSVVIFDDIHWSEEMEQAWQEIRQDNRVKLSIDLFFIGLVFFLADFREKQHFTIRFW